jgi:folate-binding protein YgfZ
MFLPLARLSRLVVTGKDRAKYLHNFCTNNIKELPSGRSCEAFFCDVKARILAHGYVLAFDDCHEIWMLAGDEPGILKHLNRYIITEDVTIESATDATSSFAAIGATSMQSLLTAAGVPTDSAHSLHEPLNCIKLSSQNGPADSNAVVAMSVAWADTLMVWLATSKNSNANIAANINSDADSQFEQLRIRERFPIINQDMSIENMVPEAERNTSAISYVKGCYLGQEPIARLDAMGHVNRALRCVESTAAAEKLRNLTLLNADDTAVGIVTSAADLAHGAIGLAVVRANLIKSALHGVADGQRFEVKVM